MMKYALRFLVFLWGSFLLLSTTAFGFGVGSTGTMTIGLNGGSRLDTITFTNPLTSTTVNYSNVYAVEMLINIDFDDPTEPDLTTVGYCVDLLGTVTTGTTYGIQLDDPNDYVFNYDMDAVTWLVDHFADWSSASYTENEINAALQASIWEVLYDDPTAGAHDTTGGNFSFSDSNADIQTLANYFLNDTTYGLLAATSYGNLSYDYYIADVTSGNSGRNDTGDLAQADGYQELIVRGNAPVPEPATMVLMGLGLLGLGVFGKKKYTHF